MDKPEAASESNATSTTRWRNRPLPVRLAVWAFGVLIVLLALLYGRLAFGPIDLSFMESTIDEAVRGAAPPNSIIELGDLSLSLSADFQPVLHFAPVTLVDKGTEARISVDALEIGVSALQTLIGQPAAVVTLINPRLQILQDLLGPRLASFSTRIDEETGERVVEIRQGQDIYPEVRIQPGGLKVSGPSPAGDGIGLRSDNDWLIYNLEAMEKTIADFETQVREGRFARLNVRGGSMEMVDPVLGVTRTFEDLEAKIVPGTGRRATTGTLGATLAGRRIAIEFTQQTRDDGSVELALDAGNLDFAALIPALDDPDALMAIKGAGTLKGSLGFDPVEDKVVSGHFDIDFAGTEFRLRHDYFPVSEGQFGLDWDPAAARFTLNDGTLVVGNSSSVINGAFVLGLDDVYGPTIGASLTLSDLWLQPGDLNEPEVPFSEVSVQAWAAPLYGAIGFDRIVAKKPGVELRAKGRFDMLRQGIGLDFEVGGEGARADDIKRLWPYFIATGARDWFVSHVTAGRIKTAAMHFTLPVGSFDPDASDLPLPPNSGTIDLVGADVTLIPTDGFTPVALGGDVRLSLRDNKTVIRLGATRLATERGQFDVSGLTVEIDSTDPTLAVIEFSGMVKGQIPAVIAFADSQSPGLIKGFDLPFDAQAITGEVEGSAVVTLSFKDDPTPVAVDYAVNGVARDFGSSTKIADRSVSDGQLTFQATRDRYHVAGTANLDGMSAGLELNGGGDTEPQLTVASTIDVKDFEKFGFNLGDLMSGRITFAAKPLEDGGLQLAAELEETALSIKDIGLSKAVGVPGTLTAEIHQDGTVTKITKVDLNFSSVRVKGSIDYDNEKGLVAADFSDFALSEGDVASIKVTPGSSGGFRVAITGDQFDLKPMLKRYFALDKTSTGGPQATSVPQELAISAKLKRALGFYGVTAYNADLSLDLKGETLLDASLQAQFTDGNSVSLTSNRTSGARLMTVAFNDAGTLLRFLNVYSRVLGGSGSLTLRTDTKSGVDNGELRIKDFSIVDEARVAEIIGNHKNSQKLIAKENRLSFQSGQASFIRRSDRIEVTDGVLDGGSIGGTLKGFVYTKARKYDLTGTYIPLFDFNNMFQKLPLIGTLLGGRDGEGLVGVTFAVRGDLDNPQFVINPVSFLAPGMFRSLFEFRSTEAPRE